MIVSFVLLWSGFQEKAKLLTWEILAKVKRNSLVINKKVILGDVIIKKQGEILWVKSLV